MGHNKHEADDKFRLAQMIPWNINWICLIIILAICIVVILIIICFKKKKREELSASRSTIHGTSKRRLPRGQSHRKDGTNVYSIQIPTNSDRLYPQIPIEDMYKTQPPNNPNYGHV
uniref:Uncharacterized protein n=1 Tax=Clastoptera arizonana TaxID=38151 RepID=A0A1B6C3G8_9HEMI